jgi:valyl-tRNA synthetase
LGKLAGLELLAGNQSQQQRTLSAPLEWGEVGIAPPADFDFDKARSMLKKKLDEVSGHLDRHRSRYENPGFRAKADAETVADIAERIEELQVQRQTLEVQIGQLS